MNKLNEILQELGISKVKLAKYLGVSRQMIYNYLELESLNKWPKEKKILLFKLLDIEDGSDKALGKIKINSEYIMEVESRLNQSIKDTFEEYDMSDLKKLKKDEQRLFSDLTYIIKDKLTDEYKHDDNVAALKYVYHILQAMDNMKEAKYFLAYISKLNGFTGPNDNVFNENEQFIFDALIHSAIGLYAHGGTSKSKVADAHARFEKEVEVKNEEKLSRTQQLNTIKIQALRELGYTDITTENASEVFERMAEIESRKV
ncbi:MAG TPA: hypothetical protein DCY94_04590 [Firmicutes bacterium]|nr:hypothetical protein [Bacillota bacterium]